MSGDVWQGVIIVVCGGAALAVLKWIAAFLRRAVLRDMKAMVAEVVDEKLEPLRSRTEQLLPNGGSSLADAIRRIEKRLDAVEDDIHHD